MLYRISTYIVLLIIVLPLVSGCNKNAPEQTTPIQEETPTEVNYEAEAREDINEDNMEEELDKLEQAIEQDSSQSL